MQRHHIELVLDLTVEFSQDVEVVDRLDRTLSEFGTLFVLFSRIPAAALLNAALQPYNANELQQVRRR